MSAAVTLSMTSTSAAATMSSAGENWTAAAPGERWAPDPRHLGCQRLQRLLGRQQRRPRQSPAVVLLLPLPGPGLGPHSSPGLPASPAAAGATNLMMYRVESLWGVKTEKSLRV